MGYVEFDPETGEGTLIPDPQMDWGNGNQTPPGGGLDGGGLDGGGLEGGGLDGGGLDGGGLDGGGPGHSAGWDTESAPKPWLTDPEWTPESAEEAVPEHHGFE